MYDADKMRKGIPLSEEDRIPWLETVCDTLRDYISRGETAILSCSALQKKYREILRTSDPEYGPRCYTSRMKFVCLQASADVIADRLKRRAMEGKHFMPATLLQSQLDLLQIDETEGIIMVDATLSPQSIVARLQDLNL